MSKSTAMTTRLGANGRVVLPAGIRRKLNLKPGSSFTVVIKDRDIVLQDPLKAWRDVQEFFKPYRPKPGEKLVSEQLIEERRQAALRGD